MANIKTYKPKYTQKKVQTKVSGFNMKNIQKEDAVKLI